MIRDCPIFDKSPNPRPQWYVEDGKQWKSYYEISSLIEKAYQKNEKEFNTIPGTVINFETMREQNGRNVLRAIWFWQENDKTWLPYKPKLNKDLETEYKKGFQNEVLDPPRTIKFVQNSDYVQYRLTPNGRPEGRAVTRGYPGEGMTLEKINLGSKSLSESYIEEVKTCWKVFCSSQQLETTTTELPQINLERYCKGLGIWGYHNNPQDPWLRDELSPLATWLYISFQKDNNKTINFKSFFDVLYIETQGDSEQCRKFAYRRILENFPSSIYSSFCNAFTILKEVLKSIGLAGKRRSLRLDSAEQFVTNRANEKTLNESTYLTSSFLNDLIHTYFPTNPPRSRLKVPYYMNPLIPFDRHFNLAVTISLGIQLAVEKADLTYLDRSDDHIWPSDCGEMIRLTLPSVPGDPYVAFEDYAPQVFRALRLHYGIRDDYIASLGIESLLFQLIFCGELNTYRQISSYGKSGSVFFYSYDSRFLIKTLKPQEAECLRKRLPEYYQYMKKGKTILVPILGLYSIFIENEKMHFCVMKNLFDTPNQIHEIFDLKGSTFERSTRPEDRKPGVPLKDIDFGDRQLLLPEKVRVQLMDQVRRDADFLCHHLMTMDYSLLVGIHNVFCGQNEERVYGDGIISLTGEKVYYFGIIDYLLEYDFVKLVESTIKIPLTITGEISAVDSVKYASRFTESIEKKLWSPVLYPNNGK